MIDKEVLLIVHFRCLFVLSLFQNGLVLDAEILQTRLVSLEFGSLLPRETLVILDHVTAPLGLQLLLVGAVTDDDTFGLDS